MLKKLLPLPLNLLLLLIFLIFSFAALTGYGKKQERNPISPAGEIGFLKEVCLEKKCFSVELADTAKKRQMGLMHREKLAENYGMLFIFTEDALHNFWMKNTFIPLDIIWINTDNKIVYLNKNTLPCQTEQCPLIKPNTEARYVLEINAGLVDKFNIKIGDKINFK